MHVSHCWLAFCNTNRPKHRKIYAQVSSAKGKHRSNSVAEVALSIALSLLAPTTTFFSTHACPQPRAKQDSNQAGMKASFFQPFGANSIHTNDN